MSDILKEIAPYLVTMAIGIIVWTTARIKSKALEQELLCLKDYLCEADAKYYVICPQCGSKIGLTDVQIYQMAKEKSDGTNV